ncbi:MAG: aminotransferase class III-fold pyridoxal phosphate-dependent enzyme, partial [Pseudomonadota bacterium]
LVEAADRNGKHLHKQLQAAFADHPLTGEIRGFGLVGAVEFVEKNDPPKAFDPGLKVAIRIAEKARENGVITRPLPAADTVSFSPPLTITPDEIDQLVAGVRDAADAVLDELRTSGDF